MIRKDDEPRKVTYTEIAKGLDQGLENADPLRLAGLQTLQRVRAIKDTSLQREQARLAQKYGAQHPRLQALAAKRDANRALQREAEVAVQRAQTPVAQADPNAWTLHGYVRDGSGKGRENLTIALYDENKQWIEELGHACTDAKGYFRLTVKGGARPKADEAADTKDVQAKLARAAAEGTAGRRAVYIHVTSKEGRTLYIDTAAITPKLGEVVYREIILGEDGGECAPPSEKPTRPGRGGKDKDAPKEGRFLGNRRKKELHDLNNVQPGCQIDEIAPAQRQYFAHQREAIAAGYDLCAYCFGKERSKR